LAVAVTLTTVAPPLPQTGSRGSSSEFSHPFSTTSVPETHNVDHAASFRARAKGISRPRASVATREGQAFAVVGGLKAKASRLGISLEIRCDRIYEPYGFRNCVGVREFGRLSA
jgi:hypothetical protein